MAQAVKMIKAIIEGERNPQKLLALCDDRIIKNKEQTVVNALAGK